MNKEINKTKNAERLKQACSIHPDQEAKVTEGQKSPQMGMEQRRLQRGGGNALDLNLKLDIKTNFI